MDSTLTIIIMIVIFFCGVFLGKDIYHQSISQDLDRYGWIQVDQQYCMKSKGVMK